jgi:hypothetical protein
MHRPEQKINRQKCDRRKRRIRGILLHLVYAMISKRKKKDKAAL